MKKIIGVVAVLAILIIALCGALAIWGISTISWTVILKTSATLIIAFIAIALLWLVATLFLKKERYNKQSGNQAHPMN